MLVEVSGECSGMTGLYSQEYWKELDQCNSLLLPTLDHESNNIEMEELEEIASNFPCFNPSNLQPALIPVTLQQLTSTRIQPRSPTKLEIGPSSLEILSPRSPSHNIHSLPTIISPRLPPSRPHSTVISPHLHPQPLHPHPHSHLHPHPHPSLHLSHQSQSINSSHINSSNLLSIISSSHHLPSTPSPHHLPSAPSPHHHPTAPSPHHIPPAPSPNPLSPIQRTRCNTWPRMLQSQDMNESFYDADPSTPVTFPSQPGGPYCCIPGSNPSRAGPPALLPLSSHPSPPTLLPLLSEEIQEDPDEDESMNEQKQKISRRNPWGNFSYADLITQAIQNSPGQRLTLAQIYDWLIVNIPYFKERADVNSSAGWKNSIRHNLSLHTKFVKVQNEGTGKSSWWTIAPEIKQAPKPPRRRAASMESSKLKKEKERAMHKVRARLERASSTNSTGSCSGLSSCSLFSNEPSSPSSFSFRGIECRPRTSSSTSSDSSYTHRTDSDVSVSSCLDLADLQRCCISQNPGSDLDNIHLDNLNIQPGNIIREYLHPGSTSKQTPEQMEYSRGGLNCRKPKSYSRRWLRRNQRLKWNSTRPSKISPRNNIFWMLIKIKIISLKIRIIFLMIMIRIPGNLLHPFLYISRLWRIIRIKVLSPPSLLCEEETSSPTHPSNNPTFHPSHTLTFHPSHTLTFHPSDTITFHPSNALTFHPSHTLTFMRSILKPFILQYSNLSFVPYSNLSSVPYFNLSSVPYSNLSSVPYSNLSSIQYFNFHPFHTSTFHPSHTLTFHPSHTLTFHPSHSLTFHPSHALTFHPSHTLTFHPSHTLT
ncbi:uncharacterized protein LOC111697918 [Eurytemora carolleeae]|uniref:uncharacterized protein LOC111697918 n=1 Tax=Eurytemora carolleeae TaxID=1294199 RepID=UPI000C75AF94|nr:uncharacterized protein LOC111697918 [Eurytemora carolleeae]|eukprot:XP_023323835.1 uncharacterized protein LOC111697918 [Eurytemora affinis]